MLDTCSSELRIAAQACINAVVECFDSRKTIYLTQLKKIRETSNMATRNAVQHERSEASIFINRLKETLEAQRRKEVSDAQIRVTELDTIVTQLRTTIEANRAEIDRLSLLEQNRLALQQTAVAEAIRQTREETKQERTTLQESAATEHRRLQAEMQSTVEDMKRQMEVWLYSQNASLSNFPFDFSSHIILVSASHAEGARPGVTNNLSTGQRTRRSRSCKDKRGTRQHGRKGNVLGVIFFFASPKMSPIPTNRAFCYLPTVIYDCLPRLYFFYFFYMTAHQ